jgi:transposase
VFIDEAGSHIAMTRARARSPKGERAFGKVPRCRGTVTTIIGALTIAGMAAVMTIEGGTSGAVFTAYVTNVLSPTLRAGNVVVLDNLAAHKVEEVRTAIEATGSRLLFLPPYHPDLNPIEEGWSKLKTFIRAMEPRSTADLDRSIALGATRITSSDAAGWFGHSGYHVNG